MRSRVRSSASRTRSGASGSRRLADLIARAGAARDELEALEAGVDPLARAETAVDGCGGRATARSPSSSALPARPRRGRSRAPSRDELAALGLGEGELGVELPTRDSGPDRRATRSTFLIRANAGLPLAPVAHDGVGRRALADRARPAGGRARRRPASRRSSSTRSTPASAGRTAHAVADALAPARSRSRRSIAITHLPQIASVADRHFRVEKVPGDPTHTRIEPLAEDERARGARADARRRGVPVRRRTRARAPDELPSSSTAPRASTGVRSVSSSGSARTTSRSSTTPSSTASRPRSSSSRASASSSTWRPSVSRAATRTRGRSSSCAAASA